MSVSTALLRPRLVAGKLTALVLPLAVATCLLGCDRPGEATIAIDPNSPTGGWSQVGGDSTGRRYSPNTQINRENVRHLEEAWRFNTGDVTPTTSLQVTPILVDDQLILCTPEPGDRDRRGER